MMGVPPMLAQQQPKPGEPGYLEWLQQQLEQLRNPSPAMGSSMGAGPTPAATGMPPAPAGKAPSPEEMRAYLQSQRSNPNASLMYGINPSNLTPQMSPTGATVDQRLAQDPNYRGFRQSMAADRGLGASMKELPYDMKRGFQGKNMLGTAAGAATGMLMGKDGNSSEKALATLGGTAGAALGTMIRIPFVGQAIGGLVGSTAGKLLGGLFGGGKEDEAKKKAEREQKISALRSNLDRIAQMYRKG